LIDVMLFEIWRLYRPLSVAVHAPRLMVVLRCVIALRSLIVVRRMVVSVAGEQVQALSENRGGAVARCHQQTRNR
jgi:hypothetical protein